MEGSYPLHICHVNPLSIFINRSHTFIHSIALALLIYYRASFLFLVQHPKTSATPILPWLLVFVAELVLSFIWLIGQAYRWRPVSRTVFPERLPEDDKLPAIDVFIFTVDPNKEPTLKVMNTVLSAMALDYPQGKLHVYVSDDGGSPVTLHGLKEAWRFAKWWLPFCRRYRIKTRCPEAYFSASNDDDDEGFGSSEFIAERKKTQERYEMFKKSISEVKERVRLKGNSRITAQDHPSVIEVIQDDSDEKVQIDQGYIPLLVYVAREKRPSHPHHFKAGAINVLQRVSSVISNSPYILALDCDMYCNDPTSARQAMCFHLDPKISPTLAFVQFPQRFHNICKNDIYDAQLRSAYSLMWCGLDGLQGPVLSGTGFYIKRVSLCGSFIHEDVDLTELKQSFGSSNELIKSLRGNYQPNAIKGQQGLLKETQVLASCTYENDTKWGKEVGFLYDSVAEDLFTGFILHCKGWTSVYCNPSRAQFLGSGSANLNDLMIQGIRWSSGLIEVGFSKFCPLIYGPPRMSFLESMCYGELSFFPFYFLPLWCFATIPQLCLLNGIPLYPKVSSSYFVIFLFIYLSSLAKLLQEILFTGGSFLSWVNEQRIWMMKSVTFHLYGTLGGIMKRIGIKEASFVPSNKVEDDEQVKLYEMGKFGFQIPNMFLVPMVALIILNVASFVGGLVRVVFLGDWDNLFVQVFISFYILIINFPIIEGMIIRKDKGRIQPSVTLLSAMFSTIFLLVGSVILHC
ncbi:hypothetical protein ACJW30_02G078300 [Castanea mollissima]